jgi:hypothetical protein
MSETNVEANCFKCSKVLRRTHAAVDCAGCKKSFHNNCVNLAKEDVEFLKNEKQIWRCEPCQHKWRESRKAETEESTDHPTNISLLDIWKELKKYRTDTVRMENDLGRAIEGCHEDVKKLQKDNYQLKNEMKEMATEIELLKNENVKLRAENKQLASSARNSEQYSRMNTLEVHGCPYREHEDVYQVISSIGTIVKHPLSKDLFDIAHRLKPNLKGERGIIMKFIKRSDKNSFFDAYFKHGGLTTKDLAFPGAEKKIYVSESLSPYNRQIIKEARERKKKGEFVKVFCRNGRIVVKKQVDGPNIWIKSLDDFQNNSVIENP